MKRLDTLLLLCAASVQAQYSSLQIPKVIHYQGRVTQNGTPWNPGTGEGYFVFALVQNGSVLWNNYDGNANPSDPATSSPNFSADQMLPLPVSGGQFSVRLGATGTSGKNREIPATVFFDANSNSVRGQVKLAVWFSADANNFTPLVPDVDLASVPYAMVAGIAQTVQDRAISTAKVADHTITSQQVADGTLVVGDFSASLQADSIIPPGTVVPFAGTTLPAGWLWCDSSQVSRTTYERLYAAIGNAHGSGNGSSTFHLPDYRGRFLRGVDGGTGRDPEAGGRTAMNSGGNPAPLVGTVQDDDLRTHNHRWADSTSGDQYARLLRSWTSATGGFATVLTPYVASSASPGSTDDNAFRVEQQTASNFYTDPVSTIEQADGF